METTYRILSRGNRREAVAELPKRISFMNMGMYSSDYLVEASLVCFYNKIRMEMVLIAIGHGRRLR
jgi:hypothetical protein